MATVFRLHWRLSPTTPDGIYNVLHAVTMGRAARPGKTHLEQLVQILHGGLHITCRVSDNVGQVHRNTVALPGHWEQYLHRDMLLIYTADTRVQDPAALDTMNVLYDFHSLDRLQCLPYRVRVQSIIDFDFASWPDARVICDHEQNHVPRDHVIVHGRSCTLSNLYTPFEILRVWASLGQTLDPLDQSNVRALSQIQVPDHIGSVHAWYNVDCDRVVDRDMDTWALCTGRYRQRQSLGIKLT